MRAWLAQIGLSELIERYCHYQQEPFGYEIENYRMARICASVMSAAGAKEVSLSDFLPPSAHAPPKEKPEREFQQGLVAMFRGLKHTDKHG